MGRIVKKDGSSEVRGEGMGRDHAQLTPGNLAVLGLAFMRSTAKLRRPA